MTGKDQTAREWLERSVGSNSPSMAKEHAKVLLAELDSLAASLAKARAERDRLGNELAQERAKPGGSWDQAALAAIRAEEVVL